MKFPSFEVEFSVIRDDRPGVGDGKFRALVRPPDAPTQWFRINDELYDTPEEALLRGCYEGLVKVAKHVTPPPPDDPNDPNENIVPGPEGKQ